MTYRFEISPATHVRHLTGRASAGVGRGNRRKNLCRFAQVAIIRRLPCWPPPLPVSIAKRPFDPAIARLLADLGVAPRLAPLFAARGVTAAAELDTLPQIGEARAKAIIEARAKGKFKNWDDFVKRNVVPSNAESAIKDLVKF